MSRFQHLLKTAQQHQRAGQRAEAEKLYRQILAQQPNDADALYHLGVLAGQGRQNDLAADLIRRAISIRPGWPQAWFDLGNALLVQRKLNEAIDAYRRAIGLSPGYAEACNNLGIALMEKEDAQGAVVAYRQAIALRANFPQAYTNLGNALRDLGELEQSIAAYRQAIALDPNSAQTHSNLGVVLKEAGRLDQAIVASRQAIALQPDFAEAHNNLGAALAERGDFDSALAAYSRAIALKPKYAQAHFNLGNTHKAMGQIDQAIAAYRGALALKPDFIAAHGNLVYAMHFDPACDSPAIAQEQQRWRQMHARTLGSDFQTMETQTPATQTGATQTGATQTGATDTRATDTRATQTGATQTPVLRYAEEPDRTRENPALRSTSEPASGDINLPVNQRIAPHTNDPDPDRRLRIGYVSPDFREHPVGRFLLPLWTRHNRQAVEVFAYSQARAADAITQQLTACADCWRQTAALSDQGLADLIRSDRIDILVDLTMHMAGSRLRVFAAKPAPLQVTWLAYAGSTGLNEIDYRLSDPYMDPPGADESSYTEQTLRLPETYWCYQPPVAPPPVSEPPFLKAGHITFGCLNNFCKINDPLLAVWAKLLQSVPNSHLLLHAPLGSVRQRVTERFKSTGIDSHRLRFATKLPLADYLRCYDQIDIALDTFPYGGGTTSCDALWMGVPVVSLIGKTAVGRGGLSILSNVGLPELATASEDQYVKTAAELAGDQERLRVLRSTLRQRMENSPLMDAARFAANLEAAYREMWRRWCESHGQPRR